MLTTVLPTSRLRLYSNMLVRVKSTLFYCLITLFLVCEWKTVVVTLARSHPVKLVIIPLQEARSHSVKQLKFVPKHSIGVNTSLFSTIAHNVLAAVCEPDEESSSWAQILQGIVFWRLNPGRPGSVDGAWAGGMLRREPIQGPNSDP